MKRTRSVLAPIVGAALLSWVVSAHGKEAKFKDYSMELKDGERLVIQNLSGQIRLIPAAVGNTVNLKVRKTISDKAALEDLAKFEALTFVARREPGALIVEMKGPESKESWVQWLKAGTPDLHLEIEAPAAAVDIMARDGSIVAQDWKHPLSVALVSGVVRTASTEGPLRVQLQKGEAKIERHKGKVDFDGFAAKLSVHDLEGDIAMTSFSGEASLYAVRGAVEILSHSAPVSVAKSSGSIDFLSGRGAVQLAGFEGPVRGNVDQGSVSADIEGEAEVLIESNQGPVNLRLPASSGAAVRLQTEDGMVQAPEVLRPNGASQGKVTNGRLNGTGPKGTVNVKTKAGAIRVRF